MENKSVMNTKAIPPDKQPSLGIPQFSEQQMQWLRKMFPVMVYGPETPTEVMHQYFGTQRVVQAIESARARYASK